jgi:outer membrane protein TolC
MQYPQTSGELFHYPANAELTFIHASACLKVISRSLFSSMKPASSVILPALLTAFIAFSQPCRLLAQSAPAATPQPDAVEVISLDMAIARAQASEPTFAAASAEARVAQLDRSIARAGLLPAVNTHNQFLFTQANGSNNRIGQTATATTAPVFIANNSIHEYANQVSATETLGLGRVNAVTLANAYAARATGELEIARRGLVGAVVHLYYSVAAAQTKLEAAQHALTESDDFLKITREREQAREAAHADVIKAQLSEQQRARDVADAKLLVDKASLDLGVLLYPDPRTPYRTESSTSALLPDRATVETDAAKNNAEIRSAIASLRAGEAEVGATRAALLPELALNVTYGIDAPQFARTGPDGSHNLGYSASATVDLPVWDWLATEHKIKQAQIRRDALKVALTATQRRLIADLAEFYDEAVVARDQLASLELSAATARESLSLTKLRYTGGEGSVLEVVDAQNAVLTAETAQADGTVRYQVALANLQTLTGRF